MDNRKETGGNGTMRRFFENRWFLLVLRLALGGVFLFAGTTKAINPQAFADSIATFKMLPPQLINIVALGLPPFEILLGLMLVSGWKARAASLAVAGLSIVFGVALGQALIRGLVVDCGCFGSGEPSTLKTWASFGRAFALGAASVWAFHKGKYSIHECNEIVTRKMVDARIYVCSTEPDHRP